MNPAARSARALCLSLSAVTPTLDRRKELTMFVTGLVIFASAILLLIKLPRLWMLRALHYDIAIDVAVSVVVLALHFGTFSV